MPSACSRPTDVSRFADGLLHVTLSVWLEPNGLPDEEGQRCWSLKGASGGRADMTYTRGLKRVCWFCLNGVSWWVDEQGRGGGGKRKCLIIGWELRGALSHPSLQTGFRCPRLNRLSALYLLPASLLCVCRILSTCSPPGAWAASVSPRW